MAEEMMRAVLEEEQRAKEIVQAAREQAVDIQKQTQKACRAIQQQEQARLEQRLEGLRQQTDEAIKRTLDDQQAHTKKAVHALQQEMDKQETEAVRIVVSALLSESFTGGK